MRFLRSLPLVLLASLAVLAPSAQEPAAAAQALPEARALVQRFLTVTKYEVVAKSQSRHEKATLVLPVGKGQLESWSVRPLSTRQVTKLGDFGTFESGILDGAAWMTLPGGGATLLEGVELLQVRLDGAYDAATKPETLFLSLTTVGREAFEGVDCYKVEVVARPLEGMDAEKTKAARTFHEFYEVESGFLRGSKGLLEGEISKGPYTRVHSDYKEFAGTLAPARTILRQDSLEVVTKLESLEFDTVTAADLAPPKAIQRLLEAEAAAK